MAIKTVVDRDGKITGVIITKFMDSWEKVIRTVIKSCDGVLYITYQEAFHGGKTQYIGTDVIIPWVEWEAFRRQLSHSCKKEDIKGFGYNKMYDRMNEGSGCFLEGLLYLYRKHGGDFLSPLAGERV